MTSFLEKPAYYFDEVTCVLHTQHPFDVLAENASMGQVEYTQTFSIACKYCGFSDVVKFGVREGVQYYWCNTCKRKFAGNNALPGMRFPPEQIASAVSLFYEGLSLNAIRREIDHLHNVLPSDSTVYEWVVRFTEQAVSEANRYQANTGKIWAADETVLDVRGHQTKEGSPHTIWFWDVIDEDSRFLLASHFSQTRTIRDAETVFTAAKQRARNLPMFIVTDKLAGYIDGIERVFGGDVKHIQSQGMASSTHNNVIERFHGSVKQRTKVMRGMKNRQTANLVMSGWLVHYNYFRPHEGLNGKTPGEVAQAGFPYRNWTDIVTIGYNRTSVLLST